jgi:hypothetical protein
MEELKILINYFDKYPLITQKYADYQLFKQAFLLIDNKEHLTEEGLQKLVAIRASMNLGNSVALKAAFPDIIPVTRPLVENQLIADPNWIAGFTSGEGCFFVRLRESSSYQMGYNVLLKFQITQHIRDSLLLKKIIDYLECGYFREIVKNNEGKFEVESLKDVIEKIIPFFNKYPIRGVKKIFLILNK